MDAAATEQSDFAVDFNVCVAEVGVDDKSRTMLHAGASTCRTPGALIWASFCRTDNNHFVTVEETGETRGLDRVLTLSKYATANRAISLVRSSAFRVPGSRVTACALSPWENRVIVSCDDRTTTLVMHAASAALTVSRPTGLGRITGIEFHPEDGALVAVCAAGGSISFYDMVCAVGGASRRWWSCWSDRTLVKSFT